MVAVNSADGIVWSPGNGGYSDVGVRLRGPVHEVKVKTITTTMRPVDDVLKKID